MEPHVEHLYIKIDKKMSNNTIIILIQFIEYERQKLGLKAKVLSSVADNKDKSSNITT